MAEKKEATEKEVLAEMTDKELASTKGKYDGLDTGKKGANKKPLIAKGVGYEVTINK